MFYVNDSQDLRHDYIRGFLNEDKTCPVAIILAAVDFEWTIRRVILACGYAPSKEILQRLNDTKKELKKNLNADEFKKHDRYGNFRPSGLDSYEIFWNQEIKGVKLSDLIIDFEPLRKSYKKRNGIAHGFNPIAKMHFAKKVTNNFLNYSNLLNDFAIRNDQNIYKRISRLKNGKYCQLPQ